MYLYGVCISEINTEIECIDNFLRSMLTTPAKNIAQDYFDAVSEARSCDFIDHENTEQIAADYIDNYETEDGYTGLAAMLRDIIIANEGIDIICDDPNGFEYLGIDCDVPWAFNMNTKLLSKKSFIAIMNKYLIPMTRNPDTIKYDYYHYFDNANY